MGFRGWVLSTQRQQHNPQLLQHGVPASFGRRCHLCAGADTAGLVLPPPPPPLLLHQHQKGHPPVRWSHLNLGRYFMHLRRSVATAQDGCSNQRSVQRQ